MALMTLPPTVEIREDFRRPDYASPSSLVFWAGRGGFLESSFGTWKSEVFTRIAKLERGPTVPGIGNLQASERAAGVLRLQLAGVTIQSLPFPSVVPISGQGLHVDWRSGMRAIEITSFADGELVIVAKEAGRDVPFEEDESLDSYLKWLVSVPQSQHQQLYAATR